MFCSRPPERDRSGMYWDWLRLDVGKESKGWLIGPVVGVATHYLRETKPCRRHITGLRMRCALCDTQVPTTWKGYVPLLDERGVQAFVVIGERYAAIANAIPMLAPVRAVKLRRAGTPICVEAHAWTDALPPLLEGDRRARDLRPWLLRLWQDFELKEFLEKHPDIKDRQTEGKEPLSQPVYEEPAKGKPSSVPAPVAKRGRQDTPSMDDLVGQVLPDMVERNGRYPNGKRK